MELAVQPSCAYSSQMETSSHNMSHQAVLIYRFPEQCSNSPTFISLPEFEIHDPAECTFEGCVKTCQDGGISFRLFCVDGHDTLPKDIKVKWTISVLDSLSAETIAIEKTQHFDNLTPSCVESDWSEDNSVPLDNELFTAAASRLPDDVQIRWHVELTPHTDDPNGLVILCNLVIKDVSLEAHSAVQSYSEDIFQTTEHDKKQKDDIGESSPGTEPLAVKDEDHGKCCHNVLIYDFPEKCRNSPTFISLPEFEIHDPAECTFEGCVKTCRDGRIALRLFSGDGHDTLPKDIKVEWKISALDSLNTQTILMEKTQKLDQLTPSYVESDWSDNDSVVVNNEYFTTISSCLPDDLHIKWSVELTSKNNGQTDFVLMSNVQIKGVFLMGHSSSHSPTEMFQSVQQSQELKDDTGAHQLHKEPLQVRLGEPSKCYQEVFIYKLPEQCRNSPTFISLPEFEIHDPAECTFEGCVKTCRDGRIAFRLFSVDGHDKLPKDINISWIISARDVLNREKTIFRKTQLLDQEDSPCSPSEWTEKNSIVLSRDLLTAQHVYLTDDIQIRWAVELTTQAADPNGFTIVCNVSVNDSPKMRTEQEEICELRKQVNSLEAELEQVCSLRDSENQQNLSKIHHLEEKIQEQEELRRTEQAEIWELRKQVDNLETKLEQVNSEKQQNLSKIRHLEKKLQEQEEHQLRMRTDDLEPRSLKGKKSVSPSGTGHGYDDKELRGENEVLRGQNEERRRYELELRGENEALRGFNEFLKDRIKGRKMLLESSADEDLPIHTPTRRAIKPSKEGLPDKTPTPRHHKAATEHELKTKTIHEATSSSLKESDTVKGKGQIDF